MVSVPAARRPGESEKVTVPPTRALVADPNVPLVRNTFPVAVPLAPLTVTVTVVPWAVVKVEGDALTLTVAVAVYVPVVEAVHAFTTLATFSEPSPVVSSYAGPAGYSVSTPYVFPLVATVQLGEPATHGIAFVPVSLS